VLASIKKFFETEIEEPNSGHLADSKRQLACAALLIEVATIDNRLDERELAVMHKVLQQKFGVSPEECVSLTELAKTEVDDASSTYQFTRLVNDYCSYEDKFSLIKDMWAIAFADGDLDKYEEYIIRKVSKLIYVEQVDFIRAKQAARGELVEN
jgi:uncharacterized tellurite resistance protein B-like protein